MVSLARWWKRLWATDPLVGAYFVGYVSEVGDPPSMGRIVGRIETGATPKYLVRSKASAGAPADDSMIVDLWSEDGRCWCSFHESRSEAEKWWTWRARNAARQRERRRFEQKQQWHAPAPIREMPDAG